MLSDVTAPRASAGLEGGFRDGAEFGEGARRHVVTTLYSTSRRSCRLHDAAVHPPYSPF